MDSYLQLLEDVMQNGRGHDDRTGVGTRSVFMRQWRHDMRTGFPLLTTKRVTARWVFEELRWFLSGSTNNADLLAEKIDIWTEWATAEQCAKFGRQEGDLGPVYGKQMRCYGGYSEALVAVEAREPSGMDYKPEYAVAQDTEWTIIDDCARRDSDGRRYVSIKFGSGFTREVRIDQLNKGTLSDPFSATVAGVGYSGGYICKSNVDRNLYKVWSHMLERCYVTTCKEYRYYGGAGITVCNRWHNFACFIADAKQLLGWYYKSKDLGGYQLDKDHYRSKVYSPTTCLWLPKRLNLAYAKRRSFVATSPTGEKHYDISTQLFAERHGLSSHSISRCLRGDRPSHKGWTFVESADRGLGFTTPVDQIAQLLHDIQTSPNSRRLLVNMWNPSEARQVALPPCHTLYQVKCYEDTKEISLHLFARSIDIFLGLPYNIASYAFLLNMLGFATGYTPLELGISFSDLHLYNNHVDQAKEQLSREPYLLPTVSIAEEARLATPLETLLNIKWEHITLNGYKHHPKIEAPVAV